ncbi:tetratricopeptide repeat-containing sulfotransferase family protein [Microbulbifer agarilyticus]
MQRGLQLAPDHPALNDELGSLLAQCGRLEEAAEVFDRALRAAADNPRTYQKYAKVLQLLGREAEAESIFEGFLQRDPVANLVAQGAEHWRAERFAEAESDLRAALQQAPENIDAMRFLALVLMDGKQQLLDAEALLRAALARAPEFLPALHNLGGLLIQQHKWSAAIEIYLRITELDARNEQAWSTLGHAYARNGEIGPGLESYNKALQLNPESAGIHMSRAHLLKTLGRQQEAIAAYRNATKILPSLGEAYWSLANLKTFTFDKDETSAMQAQLASGKLNVPTQVHFHFALGKAFEDQKEFSSAWQHYHAGNQLQRSELDYDPVEHQISLDKIKAQFTPEFVQQHRGKGSQRHDPIFIVGLPRSGSTLIEQILASHSEVEGTEELPNIAVLAHSTAKYRQDGAVYPATLATLASRDFESYAREYLLQTKHHRTGTTAQFIDKMPNNFLHIGFIKLMFPNAKIINTRRFPLDSCLGAYKQLFAKGQNFTYDMLELSEYYQSYCDLMNHWHQLFPGEILDVHYEEHMDNFDAQVRNILDYCELPFEEQCLRYYETERAVKTASSEQVRQPIYRSALGLWKNYANEVTSWQEDLQEIIDTLPESVRKLAG